MDHSPVQPSRSRKSRTSRHHPFQQHRTASSPSLPFAPSSSLGINQGNCEARMGLQGPFLLPFSTSTSGLRLHQTYNLYTNQNPNSRDLRHSSRGQASEPPKLCFLTSRPSSVGIDSSIALTLAAPPLAAVGPARRPFARLPLGDPSEKIDLQISICNFHLNFKV